jgi:SAM-dependent methyltransferase
MSRIHLNKCPVCDAAAISNVMQVKDFTVSGELFTIAECLACTLRFTQDAPDAASMPFYYKSENYISHTDTAKGLINRLYHFVRKRTIVQKRRLIEKITKTKAGNILDVGSGTGAFLNEMKRNGWKVTGLEPNADARTMAMDLYGLELADISRLYHLPADYFETITLWHVLEHVHDLAGYIQQLKKLLHKQGWLFIAVPNYTGADAAIYKEYWAAYDVPRHLYHFSPRSIKVLMEKHGLNVLRYEPMWYDSFYISLLSSKYKHARLPGMLGKTNWLAATCNGFRSNIAAIGDRKKCSSVIYVIGK